MNRQSATMDEDLRAALRVRAGGDDGYLLGQIMRTVEAMPQRRRSVWDGLRLPRPTAFVFIVLLLAAALIGALAVASLIRPAPLANYRNGVIVVSDGWGETAMRAVDLVTGETVPGEELDLPSGSSPAWAADGSRYAYVRERQIMVNVLGTGDPRAVGRCTTEYRCELSWSPDGESLAVADFSWLGLLHLDSGDLREVANFPSGTRVLSPTWSPDGQTIAFSAKRTVFTVRRDGSKLTEIATEPGGALGLISVAWSPDGSRIAYVGSEPGSIRELWPLGIYLMKPDGTDNRKLVDVGECFCGGGWAGPGVTWSPDGTQIAFTSVGSGSGALYVMDADGGEPRRLVSRVGANPAWQPIAVGDD